MNYECVANENMILYKTLGKMEKMLNDIKKVYIDFDFNNTHYNEIYEKLKLIYEIIEDKK